MGRPAWKGDNSKFRELDDRDYDGPKPAMDPRRDRPPDTVYLKPDGSELRLPTFEIGLVLAGAVSAGAYSAGVLDFVIEALDKWEAEKLKNIAAGRAPEDWTVPPHAVRLTAVAGASAGSVCAAILAASGRGAFTPGSALSAEPPSREPVPDGFTNPLYDVWVRRLDIVGMLDTGDIGADVFELKDLQSLLNTRPLDEAARSIVTLALPPAPRRPWLEQGVEFGFTLGNLTGIPYRYRLVGLDGADFATTRHADLFTFRLAGAGERQELLPENCTPGAPWCRRAGGPVVLRWDEVANAALASAAFPVALKARHLEKEVADYDRAVQLSARFLEKQGPVIESPEEQAKFAGTAPAARWTQGANVVGGTVNTVLQKDVLPFTAVDGGTMNNQPFEHVRRAIAGPMGTNPREGTKATRAVVLIDPFPAQREPDMSVAAGTDRPSADDPSSSRMQPMNLLDVLPRLLKAYINQSRYDANDLSLAADPNVYSRFMLSPVRAGPDGKTLTGEKALASGSLQAFAGFLSADYRHHDFLLGRRNAEYFMRTYFSLPPKNPLFALDDENRIGTAEAPKGPYWTITSVDGKHERQIIPVVIPEGRQADHEPAVGLDETQEMARLWAIRRRLLSPHPIWPGSWSRMRAVLDRLEIPLEERLQRTVELAAGSLPKGFIWSVARLAARFFARDIAVGGRRRLLRSMEAELSRFGLNRPQKLPEPPEHVA